MKKILLLFFFVHVFKSLDAQVVVNDTYTAQQLIQNVLLGNGVSVSNVTFNGVPSSIGFFKANGSNLGLDSGMVMTSGAAATNTAGFVTGVNGTEADFASTDHGNVISDPDLAMIAPGISINDKCIIEFDFVPLGDTVKFDYVFGSEEYPGFTCSNYNDVFGFFLSGPGITGPYSNNSKNIALLPNSTTPVSINTVNDGLGPCPGNTMYYVSNNGGSTITYGGFTTVLTAVSQVVCGSTYHVKLAISDGFDHSYDSGVFLKARSLTSSGIQISSEVNMGIPNNDTTMFEGCSVSNIYFTRPNSNVTDTVFVFTSGSATNGTDYTSIPDTIVFLPGQDSVTITVTPIDDQFNEGNELIVIKCKIDGGCSSSDSVTYELVIVDKPLPVIGLTPQGSITLHCNQDSATFSVSPSNIFFPPYTISWNNGLPPDYTHTVRPATPVTYTVTLVDQCNIEVKDSILIVPLAHPTLSINAGPDQTLICPDEFLILNALASGGAGSPYVYYTWDNGVSDFPIAVNPLITTSYVVVASDTCSIQTASDTVTVYVPDFQPLELSASRDTTVCLNDVVKLGMIATGGVPPYEYSWDSFSGDSMFFSVTESRDYFATVTDFCNYVAEDTVHIDLSIPETDFEFAYLDDFGVQFNATSIPDSGNYLWDFGSKEDISGKNPYFEFNTEGAQVVTVYFTDQYGCTDSTTKELLPPFHFYIPAAFTPNADNLNDVFEPVGFGEKEYQLQIFNRWGEKLFDQKNTPWNGKYLGNFVERGTYIFVVSSSGYRSAEKYQRKGTVTVLR